MIRGQDILYFSSIDWQFHWQGSQEIALRLGAGGNRVLFVENTGVRAPRPGDGRRIAHRMARWTRSRAGNRLPEVATNVHLLSPLVLPPFGPAPVRRVNRAIFSAQLAAATSRLRFQARLIWTYLPTDTVADVMARARGPGRLAVYYCMADFRQFAADAAAVARTERAVVAGSDVVFASCAVLAGRLAAGNAKVKVRIFPPGVDVRAFGEREPRGPLTEAIAALPRPIIGYVGGLHSALDLPLLDAAARARPAWSWVYIGAATRPLGAFAHHRNVHLYGQRPHAEMPAYIRLFDVCTVPYLDGPATDAVVPTKINEYLAAGKPVVASALATILELDGPHHVLTTCAPRLPEFLAALESSLLAAADPVQIARRKRVAAQADWELRLEQMMAHIEPGLHLG
jgi:glycosyltransferase involved in cell wall biosynthesis